MKKIALMLSIVASANTRRKCAFNVENYTHTLSWKKHKNHNSQLCLYLTVWYEKKVWNLNLLTFIELSITDLFALSVISMRFI